MAQESSEATLDQVFWALSDVTRRNVLATLEQGGGATVSELAQPHGMSLPGFTKHLQVLEQAGLIVRTKQGRVVSVELAAQPMQEAAVWLSRYSKFWNGRLDALGRFLYQDEEIQPWPRNPQARPAKNMKAGPSSVSPATTPSPAKKSGGPGPSRKR